MDREDDTELAYFDYLGAREAALAAMVGYFVTDNIPADRLRVIEQHTTDPTAKLAARIALHRL